MWRRTKKNRFGEVESFICSDQSWFVATEKPVYDSLPGVKYTVECLRKDLEEAEEKSHLIGSDVEPWELYDRYETDSLGLAIREIICRLFDEECIDYKFFVEYGDKEICAEIPGDVYRIARQMVQEGINKRLDHMAETIAIQETEIASYQEFMKSIPGAEKMYREWKERRRS